MRRGVSIIQLFVSMAVLWALAWTLVPIIAKTRATTRTTSCTSNLQQLAQAVLMYTQDHGDTFPGGAGMGPNGAWGPAWWAVLQPYVHNTRILVCPSHPNPPGAYDTNWLISYGCNPNFLGWQMGANMMQVVNPAGTIMLGEKNIGDWLVVPSDTDPASEWYPYRVQQRHDGGANFAFLDGRVKWMKQGDDVKPFNLWINH